MANLLQQLNDSQLGIVIATAFHTLGAIGLLGGLIGYVAWHRHLRRGHHNPHVLAFATFLTYISILVNLLGGFMRTYETGHPHITEFASSSWVRAITIKHAFLFAGMGAAVYLLEAVAPRHLRALRDGKLPESSMTGHSVGVLLVTLGIVVAGVLGAVSTTLPTAQAMPEGPAPPVPDAYHNATGTFQSTPLAPGNAGGSFVVPTGMHDIEVALTWDVPQSNLGIQILDPQGTVVKDLPGTGGRVEGSLGREPAAGTWTYRITSPDSIVNAQWTLALRMPALGSGHEHET